MPASTAPVAVVTGASSGIGAATARALAGAGFRVVCAARRTDRIEALAEEIGGLAVTCDVTSDESVQALADAAGPHVEVLVNNAGGAIGLDRVEDASVEDWQQMYDVNVLGVLRVTRALLPALRAAADAVVVNVGSTAGHGVYPGGGGYTVAKHGLRALSETLRLELNGEPIRVTEIAPGMVRTEEFSLKRLGDRERADAVYADVDEPLVAETSPRRSAGSPPSPATSTSTSWSSAPSPRRPSTSCTGAPSSTVELGESHP